ncbi:hypothetical protein AM1BK_41630 [Neobacillus kokaensis]|uniref:Uncharacterized protein n=1 Tax=Neobacillus kokaensis TaxID=2759023 RepID=A0ABQ3N9C4_9BACI|nr:hypothetical protein AM1BK_41630 [Neobacillus kokaensis]
MHSDQKNPSHSICVTRQHLYWLDRCSEVKELLHTIANERGLDFHTDYEKIL